MTIAHHSYTVSPNGLPIGLLEPHRRDECNALLIGCRLDTWIMTLQDKSIGIALLTNTWTWWVFDQKRWYLSKKEQKLLRKSQTAFEIDGPKKC